MATKSTNPNTTSEETEPLADEVDEVNGITGQIIYPDREVDAERAAAWAAGKEDSLYPDDEEGDRVGWQNPADRSTEVQDEDEDDGE
jgi:hypothetical protein